MDYMEYITSLQNEYKFFTDMLKRLERKKKKTPGNGFAKMKCKEKIENQKQSSMKLIMQYR